jgi:NAD-dependent dihydropyrimidine dehydrogenase PreA subunit
VNGKAVLDKEKCDLDGLCIPACPNSAISYANEK